MAARATNLFVTAGTAIAERSDGGPDALPLAELCDAAEPVVLRGVARNWSLVQAGLRSAEEAMALLRAHDTGRALQYSYGSPEIGSRPFYRDDCSALNVEV